MQPKYTLDEKIHTVSPVRHDGQIMLEIDGHELHLRLQWIDKHSGEITVNGCPHAFYAAQDGNTIFVHFDGKVWQLEAHDEFSSVQAGGGAGGDILAPMPGVVVEVCVAEGDVVSEGVTLLLIESMKLQTEIKATVAGTVANVGVTNGDSFDKGTRLIEIEAVIEVEGVPACAE